MIEALGKWWRKNTVCRLGIHMTMEYDSGWMYDVGSAGTCSDCGYKDKGSGSLTPMPRSMDLV